MSEYTVQPLDKIKESNVFEYAYSGKRYFLLVTEVSDPFYKRIVSRTLGGANVSCHLEDRGVWKHLGYVPKEFLK